MTKTYKLLIESPTNPKGSLAKWDNNTKKYNLIVDGEWINILFSYQVENRPTVWELVEENLDLRSPEAEAMREEARSKRWGFIPKDGDTYYNFQFKNRDDDESYWDRDSIDLARWNMGNCHRTREEAEAWGKKYAKYFLTE